MKNDQEQCVYPPDQVIKLCRIIIQQVIPENKEKEAHRKIEENPVINPSKRLFERIQISIGL